MKRTPHANIKQKTVVIEHENYKIVNVPCGHIEYQSNRKDKPLDTEIKEKRTGMIFVFDLTGKVRPEALEKKSSTVKKYGDYGSSWSLFFCLFLFRSISEAKNNDSCAYDSRHD